MPIEVYEVREGNRVDMPSGDAPPTGSAAAGAETDAPGATPSPQAGGEEPSASPAGTPPGGEGESPPDTDDDEPLRDDSEVNAERLNRRFARLTAARRKAERERDALAQQHAIELAQLRGQQEVVQRMLQGAAPDLPQTPAPPTGPPSAEQYASHEDFVHAAATYATDQRMQHERQQQQQMRFQQDLMSREAQFKAAHPDFDTVVRGGLAGKVSPVLQQALMLVPDGPAVAYTLAQQPELVARLNSLPPPLVLVELGRLSSAAPSPPAPTPAVGSANGQAPAPTQALHAPETPLSGAGGGAPVLNYRDDMSQSEFEQWRKRTSSLPAWKDR